MTVVSAYAVPHPPLILPEVGKGQEKLIKDTIAAYEEAARHMALMQPETVVLLSPHATMYADYFHISPGPGAKGDMKAFGAEGPETKVIYDQEFVSALEVLASREGLPAGTLGERERSLDHGSVVPLRFFQQAYAGFQVVRIGVSGLSAAEHYRLGQYIAAVAGELNRPAAIIASGDLSHRLKSDGPYGFAPEGAEFDHRLMTALERADFLELLRFDPDFCEAAGECGLRSFVIMAGAFDGRQVKARRLSYEGPFGVGYGLCLFEGDPSDSNPSAASPSAASPSDPSRLDPSRQFLSIYEEEEQGALAAIREQEDVYVRTARYAIEQYVGQRKRLRGRGDLPPALAAALTAEMEGSRAGTFVSLKKNGRLRGCIGTIGPTRPTLLEEILHNAVSACAEDPRFDPVEEQELSQLVINVDVLGEPEPIETMAQLDVRRYGVIVSQGLRRGLLLPDLPGVDTPARQVEIALQKAGIKEGQPYKMERFEVIRHK
ncbi:MAG: AmmeMemoRadiSam system protein A [Clostridiales bacterium]